MSASRNSDPHCSPQWTFMVVFFHGPPHISPALPAGLNPPSVPVGHFDGQPHAALHSESATLFASVTYRSACCSAPQKQA